MFDDPKKNQVDNAQDDQKGGEATYEKSDMRDTEDMRGDIGEAVDDED